jgi:FkbM family methyltransferase
MNLRGLIKYTLFRDTTMKGEFRLMQKLAGHDCPQSIVDVGANDGFYGSNSFPFVARGWRSVLIEPHPVAFAKMQKLHAGKSNVTCLNLACGEAPGELPLWFASDDPGGSRSTLCTDARMTARRPSDQAHRVVRVERLDAVLASQKLSFDFGILSIDAEGMDYEVLLGLDLKQWHPRVIVTEDYESKNKPKADYLSAHGYRHAGQCVDNAMWAKVA